MTWKLSADWYTVSELNQRSEAFNNEYLFFWLDPDFVFVVCWNFQSVTNQKFQVFFFFRVLNLVGIFSGKKFALIWPFYRCPLSLINFDFILYATPRRTFYINEYVDTLFQSRVNRENVWAGKTFSRWKFLGFLVDDSPRREICWWNLKRHFLDVDTSIDVPRAWGWLFACPITLCIRNKRHAKGPN